MEMKVALCGKMASGKTTMAKKIVESLGFNRFSLATGVKDFGNYLFDIPKGHKDRVAYQKVGEGGRNFLYPEIWIDVLLKNAASFFAYACNKDLASSANSPFTSRLRYDCKKSRAFLICFDSEYIQPEKNFKSARCE